MSLSLSSLGLRVLANHQSSKDSLMTVFKRVTSQPSALISDLSKLLIMKGLWISVSSLLSYRFGTLLGKKGSEELPSRIIKARMQLFWFAILTIRNHFKTWNSFGSRKPSSMRTAIRTYFALSINATIKINKFLWIMWLSCKRTILSFSE
jgi:hypothetical protein